MQETTPKEQMLKKIRKALIEKRENPYPKIEEIGEVFTSSDELPEIRFAQEFTAVNGQFIFCEDKAHFLQQVTELVQQRNWDQLFCWEEELLQLLSPADLTIHANDDHFEAANVGITSCEALAARTGSILIANTTKAGRRLSIYPHIHLVVAYTSQLKTDIREALNFIQDKHEGKLPSMISNTTGPSRTADIEKTLVLGAHGPRELFLFLIDDTN